MSQEKSKTMPMQIFWGKRGVLWIVQVENYVTKAETRTSIAQDHKAISLNRPFGRSGHVVRNKLCWDASYTVGLSKQRKVGLDWYKLLCFGSRTV